MAFLSMILMIRDQLKRKDYKKNYKNNVAYFLAFSWYNIGIIWCPISQSIQILKWNVTIGNSTYEN